MSELPPDPRWPRLLSLSVHEFRTPMTVVAGYIRMLLKDRAGPLSDQQRRLLEEAEKSCGRLSALLAEVSELSQLEAGTSPFNRSTTDLHEALRQATSELPPLPDRELNVDLRLDAAPAPVSADPIRLKQALQSVVAALRRELVTSDTIIVRQRATKVGDRAAQEIVLGDTETVDSIDGAAPDALPLFDEWRGGSGLSLPLARRILGAFDGRIWGAPDDRKGGARILLPSA